jgi:hypothetical protein
MRFYIAAFVSLLVALPAASQPWYARGDFNAWGLDHPMAVDPGDATHYTANVTGQVENTRFLWKIAEEDWFPEMPGTGENNDGRVHTNAMGEIGFHLWDQTTWNDDWFPNNVRRVGYDDHQQFDWEIVGSFNNWPGPPDPNFALMDMGNGLHRGTFAMNAGIWEFKFRGLTETEWDTAIGTTFNHNSPNNTFAVANNGDEWTFELDLPNGRFRYFTAAAPGLAGDHNDNGSVDAADYVTWRNDPPAYGGQQGYDTWRANFGNTGPQATWLARNTPLGGQTQLPEQELVALGAGKYELNMTGLAPQTDYDFRILRSTDSAIVPGSNLRVRANAAGEIDLKLHELTGTSWSDGWSPANTHRVGYEDHNEFDWELMGTLNETPWTGGPQWYLTDMGNGLHKGSFTIATPGNYAFKFRQQDDWNTSIGDDFGNQAPNATFTSTAPDQLWNFELDLPNGRWRAYTGAASLGAAVPEPGAIVLVLVCGLVLCFTPRRHQLGRLAPTQISRRRPSPTGNLRW